MKKRGIMYDCHIHCEHSHDSVASIDEVVAIAVAKGMKYIASTDHFDRDYLYDNSMDAGIRQLDMEIHVRELMHVREKYNGIIDIAIGLECGFSPASRLDYGRLLQTVPVDIVLNSVHTVGGIDCYYEEFYIGLSQSQAYEKYLIAVLDSIDPGYDYNVIAHLGYVCRRAPFGDRSMNYSDYGDLLDEILKRIIVRDVSLELNTHTGDLGVPFLPYTSIIDRYIQLGGEQFTFGSDSHKTNRIGENYNEVSKYLQSKGVRYVNSYMEKVCRKHILS